MKNFVSFIKIDNNPAIIGLDNGLALNNRRHAIIWTNAYPIHWRMYAELWGLGVGGWGGKAQRGCSNIWKNATNVYNNEMLKISIYTFVRVVWI